MTDPITDMFNRIRNAQIVFHKITDVPYSKLKYRIAEILKAEGFVLDCKKRGKKPYQIIKLYLKYNEKTPAISGFKRVSSRAREFTKKLMKLRK